MTAIPSLSQVAGQLTPWMLVTDLDIGPVDLAAAQVSGQPLSATFLEPPSDEVGDVSFWVAEAIDSHWEGATTDGFRIFAHWEPGVGLLIAFGRPL